ncbi:hypothetical protein MSI_12340 [Treponema sp. JC4]|uniref:InlB B-repeat-containing protein n=1 Tax=Treponema sp. JC4 TaxID=1124982 RepID=UPI00025B0720|nr:InlB B-repeat-containing protein [Treponema sp. JC4]EID85235.1 hypothetical protein MSI_12340 [Treponema sp. JC4]
MKKLTKSLLLLAALAMGFAFTSCQQDSGDDTTYYTVTFNSNGGTDVTSQKIESGKKASKPDNPTKTATAANTYTFDNWYTSEDEGATLSDTAFDFDTAITKDITLYAKWAENAVTHTVTFDTKGGNTTVTSQNIIHGNKATRPTNPAKDATESMTYTFDNWYTSEDEGTTLSDTAFDFNTAITSDIKLFAKWTESTATYTVSFNTNGGTPANIDSQEIEYGKTATKPADPTKEGSAFKGWFVRDTEFDFTTPITGTIEITAKWFVGSKKPDAQKAVGDIVFTDGSATPYTSDLTLTDEQKEKSIAIIYKVDASKTYGVGILQNKVGLELFTHSSQLVIDDAFGNVRNVESIVCNCNYDNGTFTGDTDGSDNLAEIKAFLEENEDTVDDTDDLTHYPAFEFAINYKDKEGSHVKNTDFEDGWYIPSLPELYDIWTKKSTVNEACKLCTGKSLEDDAMPADDNECEAGYLSSTLDSRGNGQYIKFEEDNVNEALREGVYVCNWSTNVCCIRVFN